MPSSTGPVVGPGSPILSTDSSGTSVLMRQQGVWQMSNDGGLTWQALNSNTATFTIPPDVDYDSRNIDGQNNATMANATAFNQWVNVGLFGSPWNVSNVGTARPTYLANASFGRIKNVPGVQFDGVNDCLIMPAAATAIAQPYIILTVFELTSLAASCVPWSSFTAGTQAELLVAVTTGLMQMNNGGFVSTGHSAVANKFMVSIEAYNGATSFHRGDGLQSATLNMNAIPCNGVTLGCEGAAGGFFAPLVMVRQCRWFQTASKPLPNVFDLEATCNFLYGVTPQ